jgi:MFS family permease
MPLRQRFPAAVITPPIQALRARFTRVRAATDTFVLAQLTYRVPYALGIDPGAIPGFIYTEQGQISALEINITMNLTFIVFTFGSLLCGLSPSVGWLIACRALQGLGAVFVSALGAARALPFSSAYACMNLRASSQMSELRSGQSPSWFSTRSSMAVPSTRI